MKCLNRTCALKSLGLVIPFLLGSPLSWGYGTTAQGNVYGRNPLLTPSLSSVQLNHLADSRYLKGSFLKITDEKYCQGCNHSLSDRSVTNDFLYSADTPQLAEVMAYYHLDQYRDYVVNTLKITLPAEVLTVDAHAIEWDDEGNPLDQIGAFYRPLGPLIPSSITIGDGNQIDTDGDWIADSVVPREMALSSDVLVHEYAHAVTDRLLLPGTYDTLPTFMREGWADYLMASYLGEPLVGRWTDQDAFRGYRRSLISGVSTRDLWPTANLRDPNKVDDPTYDNARNYYNSMAWSGALWELRNRVIKLAGTNGKILSDRIVLRGIRKFVDTTGATDNPVQEIEDGKAALKSALADLQALASSDPQYDPAYLSLKAEDVDLAFSARFRASTAQEESYSNSISSDSRELAWSHQTGRKDVAIAVIDSGVGISKADIRATWGSEDANYNGLLDSGEDASPYDGLLQRGNYFYLNSAEIPGDQIDNDGNGYVDDVVGWDFMDEDSNPLDTSLAGFDGSHGTRVALNIGTKTEGMLWKVGIMPLRILSGAKVVWSTHNQKAVEAFRYAIDNKVPLVNYSKGFFDEAGPDQNSAIANPVAAFHRPAFDAIQSGFDMSGSGSDTLVIAAAGNANWDIDAVPVYPASMPLPNVISVTAISGGLLPGVNYGRYGVDLAAEGDFTSYAAPKVSGALGLLLAEQKDRQEAHPGYRTLTTGEIRYLLLVSTDHLAVLEGKTVSEGQLNANRLIEYYEDDADWDGYSRVVEALFGTSDNNGDEHPDLDGDEDGDGLSNALELAYGTVPVPLNAGQNYAGILYPIYLNSDGTIRSELKPQDSDQDGVGDLTEVLPDNGYYTDPANPDTDADGVQDGYDSTPSLMRVNLSNVALNKPTQASDVFYRTLAGSKATDGDASSYWQTASNTAGPHWISVDLGAETTIYKTRFLMDADYSIPETYRVQFSRDGNFSGSAVEEMQISANSLRNRTDRLRIPVRARFVRFLIESPSSNGLFFRVKEFEVYGLEQKNTARGATASASDDFYGMWRARNAIDGDITTHWQTGAGVPGPHWLRVDLGSAVSIASIATHFTGYTIPTEYTLQFSNVDPGDFTQTGLSAPYEVRVTDNTLADPVNTFRTPIKARYVRLRIDQPTAGSDFFRVGEFEINGVRY